MSKLSQAVLFTIVVSCLTISTAAAKISFSFQPEVNRLSGTTEYSLDLKGFIVDTLNNQEYSGTLEIGSLLEFPLDSWMGGGTLLLSDTGKGWHLSLQALISLSNPSDKMLDSDWDGFAPYYPRTLWSYTESEVEHDMKQSELKFKRRFFQSKKLSFHALFGGRYQQIKQTAFGVAGYQKVFSIDDLMYTDSTIVFDAYQGVPVIDYEITYKSLLLGMSVEGNFGQSLNWEVSSKIMPTFFDDRDDHLLRKKLSTADGNGIGFTGGLLLNFISQNHPSGKRPFITLMGQYTYLDLSGNQTQYWYETTDEADEGTGYTGIPHKIKSKQLLLGVRVGLAF